METKTQMRVSSPFFKDGCEIPIKYTCDGEDISPALEWESGAKRIKSFVCIMDDLDAPSGTLVHWLLYNIPAHTMSLNEGIPNLYVLENGCKQGFNDFHSIGYSGPYPSKAYHRYFFKIYGLDMKLDLKPGITKQQIGRAMKGHILEEGDLMARYGK
ncbi:MAG: YbhB/YbcL family Raf kinase inhibitor-like protein [Elusimicrobia bacterium]|nr:YbhB/YbcL family Raf kinase inhibitor-like protein [Candidatus Liberimonas magnetica]